MQIARRGDTGAVTVTPYNLDDPHGPFWHDNFGFGHGWMWTDHGGVGDLRKGAPINPSGASQADYSWTW